DDRVLPAGTLQRGRVHLWGAAEGPRHPGPRSGGLRRRLRAHWRIAEASSDHRPDFRVGLGTGGAFHAWIPQAVYHRLLRTGAGPARHAVRRYDESAPVRLAGRAVRRNSLVLAVLRPGRIARARGPGDRTA